MGATAAAGRRRRVGVLALQGDFDAHAAALSDVGAEPVLVRNAAELEDVDGLVIPGGESTALLKLLGHDGLFDDLRAFAAAKPVFGTCAGCILLAEEVLPTPQQSLRTLDIAVERNAYGRQIDSHVAFAASRLGGPALEMVFIRAPRIVRLGAGVELLAEHAGSPALVRQGRPLAATFHPELSADRRIQQLFVDMIGD
jgi:5'-phosphate synthase pdxT subunit